MNERKACPPPDELRQLLDGSLSDEQTLQCTQHMDSCTCCQSRLEQLATGDSNLARIVEKLNEDQPGATSAYWPALRSVESQAQAQAVQTPSPTVRSRGVPLHFLQPASDSVYLGRLAHFDVMRVLGRGGMGIVFEAFDSHLQRNVALKVLDPDIAHDDTARQRFCREARAAASIMHDNVVTVYQVVKAEGESLPYLVMQLISGESLEQRLARDKQLPMREIVRIAMQAAQGLAAAHEQGLIHRDIKPGNILLESSHDRVKLSDFGLARVAEDVKLTSTGMITGTPLYMSPEQALGEATDARSDLFSLGAVLYEMCAGQPPYSGDSVLTILKQIADGRHRPLRELNPAVPGWLATTIDSLLAKKPADRIQSAAQVAELFEYEWALMKTSSDEVPQVCEIEQRRKSRRNRIIAGAIAATCLTLGLLGGWLLSGRGDAVPAAVSSAEPVAVLTAGAGTVWSVAFNPADNRVAMAVEDGTVRLWDTAKNSVESTFEAHRGMVWKTLFSHDGKLLATAGDDGEIKLWNLADAKPQKSFAHPNAVRGLAFTHDDRTLVAGDRVGGVRVWPLDADQPSVAAEQPGAIFTVALSPDDQTLATAGSDKVIRLWNAKTLAPKLSLSGHSGPVYGLSFHRDGRRMASGGWDRHVRIWDSGNGTLVKSWEAHDGDIWGVAYSPDGSKLVTGGTDGAVKLWNAETGELLATFLGHKTGIHTVAFNHDGTLVASGGRDGAVRIWKVE